MPRPYSEEFLRELARANTERIGVCLGKVCIKSNFPTSYVAEALNVSRFTIHKWFRGEYLRDKNYIKVLVFIKLVEESLAKGVLPAATLPDAKRYLESISNKVNKVV
jgi:hypothetical protein